MPDIPRKQKSRPWVVEKKPFEGRKLTPELVQFYNSKRWRGLRKLKITRCPLCENCKEEGMTELAEHVDHDRPILTGKEPWALDWANLRSLCRTCHNRKTGQSGGYATKKNREI